MQGDKHSIIIRYLFITGSSVPRSSHKTSMNSSTVLSQNKKILVVSGGSSSADNSRGLNRYLPIFLSNKLSRPIDANNHTINVRQALFNKKTQRYPENV